MIRTENFAQVEVTSAAQLRAWLEANHTQTESAWVVTYKKHTGAAYVSTSDVLDELLCFGWIDGIRRKLAEDRTMQMISPRKTRHWARSYKERAERLQAAGRMHPAGLAAIEAAKQAGLWNSMDDVDALQIPDDLQAALQARPAAWQSFSTAAPSYRRNVLRWIKLARTPATRTKRIAQTVALASRGEKVPQM
ncbi:MAG: hypothetical protein HC915_17565 [Anaerolineae bacterium]|nr:hypothetical protein [Anaerolineae bacterium]